MQQMDETAAERMRQSLSEAASRMPQPTRGRDRRVLETVLVTLLAWIGAVGLLALGAWCTYWAPLRGDQYQLIHLGQVVADGGRMYVDCWENKPPGIAWINALAIRAARGDQLGAWVAPGVALLGALVVFWPSAQRILGSVPSCAALVLAAVIFSTRFYDTPSINPDFYCAVLALVAISLFVSGLDAHRFENAAAAGLLAGLCWSAALAVKQTGLLGLVCLTLVGAVQLVRRAPDRPRWLLALICNWIGAAIGVAAVILVLQQQGTLGEAWRAIAAFNVDLVSDGRWSVVLRDWRRAAEALRPAQLLLWFGAVGAVYLLLTRRGPRLPAALVPALLLWWAIETALAVLGPSMSMRYWQASWPPLLWLAAGGLFGMQAAYRRLAAGTRATWVVVSATAVVLLALPLHRQYVHGAAEAVLNHDAGDAERAALRAVAAVVERHAAADEPIYVLNYDPGVYVHSRRNCAARYTYPRSVQQAEEIVSRLEAGAAAAILRPVQYEARFDELLSEPLRMRIDAVLDGYTLVTEVHGYRVFVRGQSG